MSFHQIETSPHSGELVQFFRFEVGTDVYLWNSSARTLSIGEDEYAPAAIALAEPEHGRDSSSMRCRISVPRDNPVATLFRQAIPDTQIPVTVTMKHAGDAEVVGAWSGTIVSCEWRESEASLVCEINLAKIRRLGLRQRFQTTCNLQLYSERCGVNREDFKATVTVSAVNGLLIAVSGMPSVADQYYAGGYAQDEAGTRRFIASQVGNELSMLLPFESLSVGDSLDIYAGDDHTHETCRDKFDNIANFFGFFTLPGRNPWTQGGLTGAGLPVSGGRGIIPT